MVDICKPKLLGDLAYGILLVGQKQLFCTLDPQALAEIVGAFAAVFPD